MLPHQEETLIDQVFDCADLDLYQLVHFGLSSDHQLVMLRLRERVQSVFPPSKDFNTILNEITTADCESDGNVKIPRTMVPPESLKGIPLAALCEPEKWKRNSKAVSLILLKIDALTRKVTCCLSPVGEMSELIELLKPLATKNFKISSLVPAMEYLRNHCGGIVMRGYSGSLELYDRFCALLDYSWAIQRYIDPIYIFVEEPAGTPFGPVSAAINTVNERLSEETQPGIEFVPVDLGGPPQRIFSAGELSNANKIASAYRSALQIPGQNGPQQGPHVRIATLNCRTPPTWW